MGPALEYADAVVVLRVFETGGAQRWNMDQSCLIATEHAATVSDVPKLTAPADARPLTIRLLELGARFSYMRLATSHRIVNLANRLSGDFNRLRGVHVSGTRRAPSRIAAASERRSSGRQDQARRKIRFIGPGGAGKTTIGAALAATARTALCPLGGA